MRPAPQTPIRSRDFESYTLPSGIELPSVSTILRATPSADKAEALERWRRRVGEKAATEKRDRGAARGKAFHDSIRRHLAGLPTFGGVWLKSAERVCKTITRVLPIGDIGRPGDRCEPVPVWNEIDGYAGTPDAVVEVDLVAMLELVRESKTLHDIELAAKLDDLARTKRSAICVPDWKSWDNAPDNPSRPKRRYHASYCDDHRQQVAAYVRALPLCHDVEADVGFVVVALPDRPALVFPVDLELEWSRFAERLARFHEQQRAQSRVDEARAERGAAAT